jgi:uncharacterized protein involved in exopolysaccharide biosynthesis
MYNYDIIPPGSDLPQWSGEMERRGSLQPALPVFAPSEAPAEFYWNRLRRRWLLLLASTLVCGATALYVSALQEPEYRANATVEISGQPLNIEDVTAHTQTGPTLGDAEMQT